MGKTKLAIDGEKFLVNGNLVYSEIPKSPKSVHGLLMNARFIQAIFDDRSEPERFARFGRSEYDADQHTEELIEALPEWYAHGLRAITIGLQGGGPVFTIGDWRSIDNNPFSADGLHFDKAYEDRMHRLIQAADEIGMIIIVSIFYQAQIHRLNDGKAVRNAIETTCNSLKEKGYTNVIIEVANEYEINGFLDYPIISTHQGMASLIDLTREASGGMPVGSSLSGGVLNEEVARASDVIMIHANNLTRQEYYNMIKKVRDWKMDKPIVCNEDSPCIGMLEVAFRTQTSWGYYNNLTKQEPPADWGITPGEDTFFARRMAEGLGIELPPMAEEDQYYLQGFEEHITIDNKRWIRLASLYPETINLVEFYRNGELVDTAFNEPFMIHNDTTWIQGAQLITEEDKEWKAVITLKDGKQIERVVKL